MDDGEEIVVTGKRVNDADDGFDWGGWGSGAGNDGFNWGNGGDFNPGDGGGGEQPIVVIGPLNPFTTETTPDNTIIIKEYDYFKGVINITSTDAEGHVFQATVPFDVSDFSNEPPNLHYPEEYYPQQDSWGYQHPTPPDGIWA